MWLLAITALLAVLGCLPAAQASMEIEFIISDGVMQHVPYMPLIGSPLLPFSDRTELAVLYIPDMCDAASVELTEPTVIVTPLGGCSMEHLADAAVAMRASVLALMPMDLTAVPAAATGVTSIVLMEDVDTELLLARDGGRAPRAALTGTGSVSASDRLALLSAANVLAAANALEATSALGRMVWHGTDPCLGSVAGVWCVDGQVTAFVDVHASLTMEALSMLASLEALQVLDARSNTLAGSVPCTLATLPALHTLLLGENEIEHLPSCWLAAPSLRKLLMSHNRLRTLPPGLLTSGLLTHVDFTSNELEVMPALPPAGSAAAAALQQLRLASNSIHAVLPPFNALINLRALDLSFNHFFGQMTAETLASMPHLQEVLLDGNLLHGDLHWPVHSEQLMDYSVSNNAFTGILPQPRVPLRELHRLNAAGNQLTAIFANLASSLPQLELLDLSHNLLSRGEMVEHMPRTILKLDLSHNRLAGSLSQSWALRLPSIVILDLSHNRFSSIPLRPLLFDSAHSLPLLLKVNLANNRLTDELPPVARPPASLTTLDLRGNAQLNAGGELPSYLQIDEGAAMHRVVGIPLLCRHIRYVTRGGFVSQLEVHADPALHGYAGCMCVPGFVGTPPDCQPVTTGTQTLSNSAGNVTDTGMSPRLIFQADARWVLAPPPPVYSVILRLARWNASASGAFGRLSIFAGEGTEGAMLHSWDHPDRVPARLHLPFSVVTITLQQAQVDNPSALLGLLESGTLPAAVVEDARRVDDGVVIVEELRSDEEDENDDEPPSDSPSGPDDGGDDAGYYGGGSSPSGPDDGSGFDGSGSGSGSGSDVPPHERDDKNGRPSPPAGAPTPSNEVATEEEAAPAGASGGGARRLQVATLDALAAGRWCSSLLIDFEGSVACPADHVRDEASASCVPEPPRKVELKAQVVLLASLSFICLICTAVLLFTLVIVLRNSSHALLASDSRNVHLVILAGVALSIAGAFARLSLEVLNSPPRFTCELWLWLNFAGRVLLIVPLTLRAYRLYRIFHNSRMRRLALDVEWTMARVALSVVVALLFRMLWTLTDPVSQRSVGIGILFRDGTVRTGRLCRSDHYLLWHYSLRILDMVNASVGAWLAASAKRPQQKKEPHRTLTLALRAAAYVIFADCAVYAVVYNMRSPATLVEVMGTMSMVAAVLGLLYVPAVFRIVKPKKSGDGGAAGDHSMPSTAGAFPLSSFGRGSSSTRVGRSASAAAAAWTPRVDDLGSVRAALEDAHRRIASLEATMPSLPSLPSLPSAASLPEIDTTTSAADMEVEEIDSEAEPAEALRLPSLPGSAGPPIGAGR